MDRARPSPGGRVIARSKNPTTWAGSGLRSRPGSGHRPPARDVAYRFLPAPQHSRWNFNSPREASGGSAFAVKCPGNGPYRHDTPRFGEFQSKFAPFRDGPVLENPPFSCDIPFPMELYSAVRQYVGSERIAHSPTSHRTDGASF
jgi:hypothetical protein